VSLNGQVTCLLVTGHTARLNYSNGTDVGAMVIQDGVGGDTDMVTAAHPISGAASDCTSSIQGGPQATAALDRGQATVTDAQP
jgi:hypothetical protein